jgi:hypothetical protein
MTNRIAVVAAAILLCLTTLVLAEGVNLAKETMSHDVSFITYYPSPHGIYRKMQSSMMTVGNTDENPSLNDADFPSDSVDGQLYVGRSVVFKPMSGLPQASRQRGEMAYNKTADAFYFYNGTAWIPLAQSQAGKIKYVTSNSMNVDCAEEGYVITRCAGATGASTLEVKITLSGIFMGMGGQSATQSSSQPQVESLMVDGMAFVGSGPPKGYACPISCYGNQTCSIPIDGRFFTTFRASIAECVKQ